MADTMTRQLMQRLARLERDYARTRTHLPRNGWEWSGGRLLGATLDDAYFGGGQLLWSFAGTGKQNYGHGGTAWTETNTLPANYAAVLPTDATMGAGGGPYIALNGTDEYLYIADAAWQEPGAEELLVWGWVYWVSTAADAYAVSKWDVGADQRTFRLIFNNATKAFDFSVDVDGTVGSIVSATSTYTQLESTWYFLAGYYEPSSIVRVYVGGATDVGLTATDTAGAPPASLFNGTANLAIGCGYDSTVASRFWGGRLGGAASWLNVPSANITAYVTRLFHETRWAYGGH